MTIKILFVDSTAPFDSCSGGIATYIRHRAHVLAPLGFETWWSNGARAAVFRGSGKNWEEVPVAVSGGLTARKIGAFWLPASPLWNICLRQGINVLELADGALQQWPRERPFAIGVQCHTSQNVRRFLDKNPRRSVNISDFFVRRQLLSADGVLACSHEIGHLTAGYCRVHPDRFTILNHAFSRAAEELPAGNEPPPAEPFFLVVGNVEIMKGIDLITAGFRLYRKNGGKACLFIAGTTGWSDPNPQVKQFIMGDAFQALIRQEGDACVRFLGKATKPQLALLRTRTLACVIGSRFDAFPMVAGEAFLSHAPVILSDRTGWRGLAERYQAARLYEPHDPEGLAAAMAAVEAPDARKILLENGDRLADYLAGNELAVRTAQWYRGLCDRRGRKSGVS